MRKDARLTFRVRSALKKSLEKIAAQEGRSVAQVCEAFLSAGATLYHEKGPRVMLRYFSSKDREKQLL